MQEGKPAILILGGTNFMGKSTIDKLTQHFPHADLVTVNRGKVYWNNEVYADNPNLKHFFGDRKQHKEMGKAIGYLNDKMKIDETNKWKAVIDFSAFRWREMQNVVKALKGKTEIYIFISSDSLYNNTPFKGVPIKEGDFSLEDAYRSLKGKKPSDKYGYNKLKCEIYLKKTMHVPSVSLRLPDVIGPFDNTERFWCSLEWVRFSEKFPIELNPKDQTMPLSFVYSIDVAAIICRLIQSSSSVRKNSSYNLAFKESPTYKDLMLLIAAARGEQESREIKLKFKPIKEGESNGMYPSTDYTCIDCGLAQRQIGWNPTPIKQALKETVNFFLQEGYKYSKEEREMRDEFRDKISNP